MNFFLISQIFYLIFITQAFARPQTSDLPTQAIDRYPTSNTVSVSPIIKKSHGFNLRSRVIKDPKYKYILLKETLDENSQMISQVEIVGNSCNVILKPQSTIEQLSTIAAKYGAQVSTKSTNGEIFNLQLINYDGKDPNALDNLVSQLQSEDIILLAEIDIIFRQHPYKQ